MRQKRLMRPPSERAGLGAAESAATDVSRGDLGAESFQIELDHGCPSAKKGRWASAETIGWVNRRRRDVGRVSSGRGKANPRTLEEARR